ncbi:MAG: TonB-dependent receptor domain-containing protein [Psychrobium sp.]
MKISSLSALIASILCLPQAVAATTKAAPETLDVITITAPRLTQDQSTFATGSYIEPDVADWLSTVPGANINKNGPITGIAQYRGMFGSRIAKSIGGQKIVSAGPNAMDAPLTYLNPVMIESLSVYRGIAPVSSGIDTIGGAIDVKLKQADPQANDGINGMVHLNYNEHNDASTVSGNLQTSSDNFGMFIYANQQQADDYEDANKRVIKTSQYDKTQAGLDLRFDNGEHEFGVSWHHSKTDETGTPALPMDIDYIDTDRFGIDGKITDADYVLTWQLGYQDATHGMDNYQLRTNMMAGMHRYTTAIATTYDYKIELELAQWLLGVDGVSATHDADIENPNNAMFLIRNFNDVKDQRHSIFAQYSQDSDKFNYTLGARVKFNSSDSGDVSSSMAMMNPHVKTLQTAFNQSDKSTSDTTFDLVANSQTVIDDTWTLLAGAGVKQRAPSYQERYLWLPMQATGGLADGKTYIGNINLDPETAYQIDIGAHYQANGISIEPHLFYQKVDDYIQGVSITNNPSAMMVANMMGDSAPLQFSNIDATIYGLDINWRAPINEQFALSGLVNYVRGKREDSNDDLYRISPLNAQIALHYSYQNWQSQLSIHAFDKQNRVSELNNEQRSAGYAVVDWKASYDVNNQLALGLGVTNLLNKNYQPHLGGINRANGSDLAVGERISARGRAMYVSLDYQF